MNPPANTGGPGTPRPCRDCDEPIILARRPRGTWRAYEATDVEPWSQPGCHVLVNGEAWQPLDLIEHFQATFEATEHGARELVAGYPFHRPHVHPKHERRR